MKTITRSCSYGLALAIIAAGAARADDVRAELSGYQEVPVISSGGSGKFSATIDEAASEINWELTYGGTESSVLQSHIHIGSAGTAGSISAFLCTNLGNFPAQPCPQSGTIAGTIRPADVIGPASQGIAPGEFDELVRAIRAGVTYVNVHTAAFPPGEIRGQLGDRKKSKASKKSKGGR